MISGLSNIGIEIGEEDDDMSCLFSCIDMDKNFSFRLKSGMTYETIVSDGVSVSEFLFQHTNLKILNALHELFVMNSDFLPMDGLYSYDEGRGLFDRFHNSNKKPTFGKNLAKSRFKGGLGILFSGVR